MVFGHGFGLELAQGAFDHLKRHFHRETPFAQARTCRAGQSPRLIGLSSRLTKGENARNLKREDPYTSLGQTKGALIGFTLGSRFPSWDQDRPFLQFGTEKEALQFHPGLLQLWRQP